MLSRLLFIAITVCAAGCTTDRDIAYDPAAEYWDCGDGGCNGCPTCPVCPSVAKDACDNEGAVTASLEGSCWREWCVDGERTLLVQPDGTKCVYIDSNNLLRGGQCVSGGCK